MTDNQVLVYRNKLNNKSYMDMAIDQIAKSGFPFLQRRNRGNESRRKKVQCTETGIIYNSAREASLTLGMYPDAVSISISHKSRCGGYHWMYV